MRPRTGTPSRLAGGGPSPVGHAERSAVRGPLGPIQLHQSSCRLGHQTTNVRVVAQRPAASYLAPGSGEPGSGRGGCTLCSHPGGDLGARAEAQPCEHLLDMALGGALRDGQACCDVFVRQPVSDKLGDLSFPSG